jgi:orotidine-5'-phosphate decarboxylase
MAEADFKGEFIRFLLETGALKVGGDYNLKSGRISPVFANLGDFNDGNSLGALADFYADALIGSGVKFNLVYGIPEKGTIIAPAVTTALARKGTNVSVFITRKVPKEHGEASNLSAAERIKKEVAGRVPKPGDVVAQLDDVFTTGEAKYDAVAKLDELGELVGGKLERPILVIGLDRQEVAENGLSAIVEYERRTGTRVVSVANVTDVYNFLKGQQLPIKTPSCEITEEGLRKVANYFRCYGTEESRKVFGKLEDELLGIPRSVVPALDVEDIKDVKDIVRAGKRNGKVVAFKVGLEQALWYGLPRVVGTIKSIFPEAVVIYDHQKAGTDIPALGMNFARVCKKSGVDAVILFPESGPETERAWMYHALNAGLKVLVGGWMTHKAYAVSEGGWILDEKILEMYKVGARAGIRNYVVPGTKPQIIKQIRDVIVAEGIADPILYSPGFLGKQGGVIEEAAAVAGDKFHAIAGTAIISAENRRAAMKMLTAKL